MTEGRFALIIANDQFGDPGLQNLVGPSQDAKELADVLSDRALGGFQVVPPLVNESSPKVSLAIYDFFRERKTGDVALLYFSGHGLLDDDGHLYFATADTRLREGKKPVPPTALSSLNVHEYVRQSSARRKLLLLDCCYSGAFAQAMGLRLKGEQGINLRQHFEGKGYLVLASSNPRQYSLDGSAKESGDAPSLFTRTLVEGLKTGDADEDKDGWFSFDEVGRYVSDRVRAEALEQQPTKFGYVEGALYFGKNPRVKPAELPDELQSSVDDRRHWVRLGVVQELNSLLFGRHKGMSLAAHQALAKLRDDYDLRVRNAAEECLSAYTQSGPPREEHTDSAAASRGRGLEVMPENAKQKPTRPEDAGPAATLEQKEEAANRPVVSVVMPGVGESITTNTLTKWLKKSGEHVERDEPLFEISNDKVDAEIPSPVSGVLAMILVKEGETVRVDSVVGVIDPETAPFGAPEEKSADKGETERMEGEKVQARSSEAEACRKLGRELYEQKNLDGAIALYRKALQLQANDIDACLLLASALGEKGDLDGAAGQYRQALQKNPRDAETRCQLALVLKQKGELEGAIQEYREVLRLQPDDSRIHLALASTLEQKGDRDGAVAEYREALRLGPPNAVKTHRNLARVLWNKGDLEGAISEYREALRLKPESAPLHHALGQVFENAGYDERAINEYREALRLSPQFFDPYRSLGQLFEARAEWNEAISVYKEATYRSEVGRSARGETECSVGRLLEQKGDLEGAKTAYRAAADLGDTNAEWRLRKLEGKKPVEQDDFRLRSDVGNDDATAFLGRFGLRLPGNKE